MKRVYPKDCHPREVCTKARSVFVYKLNAHNWEWHEQTGTDHGTDIVIELVENNSFTGKKIEGQLKGTTSLCILKNGEISYSLDVKMVNYALNTPNPFVLFLVNISNEDVYYLPIQDYFINNEEKLCALMNNHSTINVHIRPDSIMDKNEKKLMMLAKSVYSYDSSGVLKKYS